MTKIRPGNKKNSFLNGEWAKHVRKWGKKFTSSLRRQEDKKIIRQEKGDIIIYEQDEYEIYKD